MITGKNITKHEFIGLEVEIKEAKNKDLVGLKGKVVDETKTLLVLDTSKGEKKVLKEGITLKIRLENEVVEVDGKVLVGKPEERMKK
ncbi:MAG: ribonuclease P protein subunit [archaeon]